ncbi:MAG TPA: hypothetical protein DCP91_00170 [Eggerthellaceae bacterium]|nr:hypothetical protein [Eggerthellaceae bacterium]
MRPCAPDSKCKITCEMNVVLYIAWGLLVAAWLAALALLQRPIRARGRILPRILLAVGKCFLGTLVAFGVVVGDAPLPYWTIFALAASYVALFGDAVADLLALIVGQASKKMNRSRLQIALSIACTAAFLLFGTINMQTVSANHVEASSSKLASPHTFVFVADLHVGSAQSMQTTRQTIQRIGAEEADFVVLGGDIVDAFTTREEMEETFALFGAVKAPVYFIYGNHDRQMDRPSAERAFTPEELEQAMRANGIHILQDEWARISDDLVLLGREDYSMPSRKDVGQIAPRPDDAFVLLADHSPYETQDMVASGADLQISGHSHAGQLFPLQAVYSLAGYDAYGFFRHGETELYVSSGASGWCFPFRTEEGCHYEVVSLQPA